MNADAPEHFPWLDSYPKSVAWTASLPCHPVHEMLEKSVAEFGAARAMDFLDRHYTYAELGNLVNRAAQGLQKIGVVKGTRVGLFLPNTPSYIIMYYAILKVGGVVVNFNPLYAEREVAKQIADSGCELMVALDLEMIYARLAKLVGTTTLKRLIICRMADILPLAKRLLFPIVKGKELAHVPHDERHIPFHQLIDNEGKPAPVAIDPQRDVAVLQYTGGTTGVPKGAMLTHANLVANTAQCLLWFSNSRRGKEKMLAVIPFFHVFAMTAAMNMGIMLGAEIIIVPRFELKQTIEIIDVKKPTLFPAVPTIYTAINAYRELGKYDLSSIQYCISGGAPLPVEVKRDFEKLTGCVLVEGYGLSETSPVATCNPVEGENRAGSIGLPLPGTVIEIVSMEDGKTALPPGERGEVCISGPQVMAGYWKNEGETANVLREGPYGPRLHTGDVGVMDPDGYVRIVDRIKDMIACGGFKVYPRNVEEAIYLHPAVEECVVAGIPDAYRGQSVKAYLKLREGQSLTKDELTGFLKDKLSPIEMPRHVEFRDSLPKTLIGKLSRKALMEEEAAKS